MKKQCGNNAEKCQIGRHLNMMVLKGLDKKTWLNAWKQSYPVEWDIRRDKRNTILDDVRRTVLCQKDPVKRNSAENFRPIACLPLLWKLLTDIISGNMYCFMENENLLPEEEKGCRRESRGTKDQLLIDKTILKDSRKRRTILAMVWIDYRKAYDYVPHSWVLECLDILGIADNVRSFLEKNKKKWKLSLNSNGSY